MAATDSAVSEQAEAILYRWTDEDTRALIHWRAANPSLFTGRRHASIEAYNVFLKERGLEGKVEPKALKKRWENLVSKYKVRCCLGPCTDLKRPRTGVSTEGGGVTAASWKWYSFMDEAIGSRPSVTPPVLFASSSPEVAVTTPHPVETGTTSTLSTPKRRRVDRVEDILAALKDSDRQNMEALEEMERVQQRRDEAREREAREAAEREERRHQELMEREERRHREMMEREERFYRDLREREERRDREVARREERLMAVLERLCK
ncbi:trihelix transcription factor GT-3a-like [Melanotaenia boesemani]|uniref:trihelix transcription factor GT-3a-like n=1 Tax=Melanotaenia boesemani TaxID=1250792 RepID=UPI001C055912|nr:trihelix transcription factor GT-3a-like [Melanotaenia boesemani]